jgi:hypothetical protein
MARRAADRSATGGADGFVEDGSGSEEDSVPTDPGRQPRPTQTEASGSPRPPGASRPRPAPGPADTNPQFAAGHPAPGDPGWVPPPPVGPPNGPVDLAVPIPPRRQPRGPRVVQGRRTRQVIRRVDSWTVFKLSLLFYLCCGLIVLVAGIALWNIAGAFDVITNVEKFIQKLFDLQTFKLQADVILAWSTVGVAVLVLLGTGANVLMVLLYNLISDVIGGIQVIVLEETDAWSPAGSDRGKGRTGGGSDDGRAGRRDRPPVDDPSLSP